MLMSCRQHDRHLKKTSATVEQAMKSVFSPCSIYSVHPFNTLSTRVIHGFENNPDIVEGILLGHILDGDDYLYYC